MQPMVLPVDHESRNNSHRITEEIENEPEPTESTPLINGVIPRQPRSPVTTAIVSILLLILSSGVIIGIYLLVLQNDAENILPPVDAPLMLVIRTQWDNVTSHESHALNLNGLESEHVVAVQTDSRPCWSRDSCVPLLHEMKGSMTELPYNFLVASDGAAYEAIGWHRRSPLYQDQFTTLVIGFIGNFTKTPPSHAQMKGANQLLTLSVSQKMLRPSFKIIGKNTRYTPKYLYQSLEKMAQWSSVLSDK